MKKHRIVLFIAAMLVYGVSEAQVVIMPRIGMGYGYRPRRYRNSGRQTQQNLPPFHPTVNIFAGYGFPNLDKDQFLDYYGYYRGNSMNNTGPIAGSIDYQFSRTTSIGVMVTHGKTSVPYYDGNSSSANAAFTGSLDNWAVMLNLMNYMPVQTKAVSPYIRTAIGVNIWKQNFTDASGNPLTPSGSPSDLAYQISLGTTFNLSKNFGFFAEAGYGKYILMGGLAWKF
jgi:hypothetical protein